VATDPVRELAEVATRRHDGLEARVRALELADARRDGAASGWARAQPWLSLAVAVGALASAWLR
jgi:hypothetical protein